MKYSINTKKDQSKKQKQTKLPKLLMVIMAGLLILQVLVSNRLATTGVEMSRVELDIYDLTQSNQLLQEQVASASALLTIKEKATQMGFVFPVSPKYISREPAVALDLIR